MKPKATQRGFSLIELIVVTSIIALLASVVLVSFTQFRYKANNARRLAEIQSVKKSLELYYISHLRYPDPDGDGCGGWDTGNTSMPFFSGRGMESNFAGQNPPIDITKSGNCQGYRYYLYPAGSYGCPVNRGDYYVLGITDMDTTEYPYPGSPGWSCPGRDWQQEFDWVTGDFEN